MKYKINPLRTKTKCFFCESPEIHLIGWLHTYHLNCVKGMKKYTNVSCTGLGKDMQRPPFRASYKQMDFDMKFMACRTFMLNIIVFIRLITLQPFLDVYKVMEFLFIPDS